MSRLQCGTLWGWSQVIVRVMLAAKGSIVVRRAPSCRSGWGKMEKFRIIYCWCVCLAFRHWWRVIGIYIRHMGCELSLFNVFSIFEFVVYCCVHLIDVSGLDKHVLCFYLKVVLHNIHQFSPGSKKLFE